jgi:hypothetical protein
MPTFATGWSPSKESYRLCLDEETEKPQRDTRNTSGRLHGASTRKITMWPHIFSLLSLFWKTQSRLTRSPRYVPLYSPSSTSECLNSLYETWYVCRDTWAHLNGVLHKSLPPVCVSVCVSLLGNSWTRHFLCSPCGIKASTRLVLPRTYYYIKKR